jgi:predicted nucleotidyltransferase
VQRLELIDSAATVEFDPSRSDLDFLVEFSPEADAPWLGDYFEL